MFLAAWYRTPEEFHLRLWEQNFKSRKTHQRILARLGIDLAPLLFKFVGIINKHVDKGALWKICGYKTTKGDGGSSKLMDCKVRKRRELSREIHCRHWIERKYRSNHSAKAPWATSLSTPFYIDRFKAVIESIFTDSSWLWLCGIAPVRQYPKFEALSFSLEAPLFWFWSRFQSWK